MIAVVVDAGAVVMEDRVAKRDSEDVCLYLLQLHQAASALHNIC